VLFDVCYVTRLACCPLSSGRGRVCAAEGFLTCTLFVLWTVAFGLRSCSVRHLCTRFRRSARLYSV